MFKMADVSPSIFLYLVANLFFEDINFLEQMVNYSRKEQWFFSLNAAVLDAIYLLIRIVDIALIT
jgi:hypothetical protein